MVERIFTQFPAHFRVIETVLEREKEVASLKDNKSSSLKHVLLKKAQPKGTVPQEFLCIITSTT